MHLSFDSIYRFEFSLAGRRYGRFAEEIEDIDSHIFYSVPTSFFTIGYTCPENYTGVGNRS